jgi:hypothetical protein
MGFGFGRQFLRSRGMPALGLTLSALFAVVLFCSAPAWSFDTHHATLDNPYIALSDAGKSAGVDKTTSPTVTDSCLPLLTPLRHTSPNTVTDWNQRPAGKAAAFGIIFGVRFALGPKENAKSRSAAVKPELRFLGSDAATSDRSALTVSAYRQCRKQQALQELNEFRWRK